MSDNPGEIAADRSTAAERVPMPDQLRQHDQAATRAADHDRLPPLQPEPAEKVRDIGLNRRQSRTIAAPRKWRRAGLTDLVCPECRAKVPSIADGFWHLQTAHNQGKGVDLEAWGRELRDELDEYIDASRGRRGIIEQDGQRTITLGAAMIGLMVLAAIWAAVLVFNLATGGG